MAAAALQRHKQAIKHEHAPEAAAPHQASPATPQLLAATAGSSSAAQQPQIGGIWALVREADRGSGEEAGAVEARPASMSAAQQGGGSLRLQDSHVGVEQAAERQQQCMAERQRDDGVDMLRAQRTADEEREEERAVLRQRVESLAKRARQVEQQVEQPVESLALQPSPTSAPAAAAHPDYVAAAVVSGCEDGVRSRPSYGSALLWQRVAAQSACPPGVPRKAVRCGRRWESCCQ